MSEKDILTITESMLVGAVAGAIEVTINLPLWTIKTRAQTDMKFSFDPRVLYRGYSIALATNVIITALQLSNSSIVEHLMPHKSMKVSSEQRLVSAFLGGAATSVIFGPIDLLGTQYHKHEYSNYVVCVKETVKKIGLRGLFIGTPATAITDGIFTCAFFGAYPYIKEQVKAYMPDNKYPSLTATLLTGPLAVILSHPTDMIKSIQQVKADESNKSMLGCFKDLYRAKSGPGMFKTLLFKAFPQRALWLTSAIGVAGRATEEVDALYRKLR